MVRISDIQDNKVLWKSVPYCDIDEDSIETYLLAPNDILFARTGGTVGKFRITWQWVCVVFVCVAMTACTSSPKVFLTKAIATFWAYSGVTFSESAKLMI